MGDGVCHSGGSREAVARASRIVPETEFRIRIGVGDRVIVEMSPYDLQRGRISFRHKGDAPAPAPQQRRPNFRRR